MWLPPKVRSREGELRHFVAQIHNGTCPECNGSGPVDVHTSHRIWSILLMTSWRSDPSVCCKSCGVKKQAGAHIFSLFFGWWGFPWGIILKPVWIVKNISGMFRSVDPVMPSPELERAVRLRVASRILAERAAGAVASRPIEPA